MKIRGFGHLKTQVFTINTSKTVGFEGSHGVSNTNTFLPRSHPTRSVSAGGCRIPPWEVARVEVEVAEAPVPGKADGCRFGPDVGGVEVRYRISWVGWLFHP